MDDRQEAIARIIDPGSWMALENDGELDGSLWVNRRNLSMRKAAAILRLLQQDQTSAALDELAKLDGEHL